MTEKNPWTDIVGPCYLDSSLIRLFHWSREELSVAVKALDVLELVTDDGLRLYPAFQFDDGRPVHGLAAVLRVLRAGVNSPWTWAQWLNTPLDHDGVIQPANIDRLRAGQLDDVLLEARNDAAVWRS